MASFIEILLWIFFATAIGLLLGLISILIMHVLMPHKVLKTYFKEPYFSGTEITMFTGFPFGYIRTVMFMRVLGFPGSGEKRGLEKTHEMVPVWYCKLSKYILAFFIPNLSLLVLISIVVSAYALLYE